jgi:predicted SAM-dependent methyltransferase
VKYLNLGCGSRLHPDWTNVDFVSTVDGVLAHDLRTGIPFADGVFHIVYHSHVLEHFGKTEAGKFLKECFRVLRPGGVLRVAVPNLETIARVYLSTLQQALEHDPNAPLNYDWIMLELFDQTVRNASGGEAAKYLSAASLANESFILERWGQEARSLIEHARAQRSAVAQSPLPGGRLRRSLRSLYGFLRNSSFRREIAYKLCLGRNYEALQIGRFRLSGEIHQWMYDRYSLNRLLKECGFVEIVQRLASESYAEKWSNFNLDTQPDGTVYKPDSLFMEALKPNT